MYRSWYKRALIPTVLLLELCYSAYVYVYGTYGLRQWQQYDTEIAQIMTHITHITRDIESLRTDIQAWQTTPFLYEKVARETLHMARPGEIVYIYEE